MRRLWLAVPMLLVGCRSADTGTGFQTSAPPALQQQIGQELLNWHHNRHPGCQEVKPVRARNLYIQSDSIAEAWTVEGCGGKRWTYRVLILRGDPNLIVVGDMPK